MRPAQPLDRLIGIVGELQPGTVSLVGAGPGDSALISVRGAIRLTQADVILHDKLIGPELLELPRPDAERIFVGKWRGQHVWTQEEINTALVRHARAGKRVVRLKGGDPFVFGRGGEECRFLASAGVPFEVVPGITAAFGAPATAGIPLTHRGLSRSIALVTGHADVDDPDQPDFRSLAGVDTLVFYMGMKNLAANCQKLVEAGIDVRTPAAVIHWGTRPWQRTIVGTVGDIADRVANERMGSPAMVLIGQVVRLRESLEWFEHRPLHGQTIVVTRMRDQAASLSGPLRAAGAEVIEAPTIELAEVEDFSAVDAALRQACDAGASDRYAWIVLTSANGVDAMFSRMDHLGFDARALAGVRIAAIGSATAERLGEYNIRPDLIPDEAVGESMADELIRQDVTGRHILLLRADIARQQLPDTLRAAGALCDDLPIYRTTCPQALPAAFLEAFDRDEIDWITLTSPSSFTNLLDLLDDDRADDLHAVKLASIGPVTTRAIREEEYTETVEADPHDVPGLVAAILAAMKK